jgi:C4-dicarboxylate transporter DctM subunit
METSTAALLCTVSMFLLLLLGVPIAYALGLSTAVFGFLAFGTACLQKIGWVTYNLFYNLSWTPLPLFVLMACIITETKIGEELFGVARNWLSRLPGGLISASIMGEALIASTVGVSGAAILTVGKVAEPELTKYGYNRGFALGGLMCGGVLGPLIPPSTPMIIYGVIANVSVGHLLIAGVMPGVILAIMLAATPLIICWRNPALGPPGSPVSWRTRFASLSKIWPVIVVMAAIIGSIYMGIATPTEAAGIGCVVIIIISFAFFKLRLKNLYRAMIEAAVLNAMIMVIVVGASFFSYMLASADVGEFLSNMITSLGVAPIWIVVAMMILYLILGCLFETLTITVLTVPIFVPIITNLGFDPVWFGVLYLVNMEIGLITPPMGLSMFYMRNVFNIETREILQGAFPYLIVLFAFLIILLVFPQISLWLPSKMG